MSIFDPFRRNRTIRRETKAVSTETGEVIPVEADIFTETPDGGVDFLHIDTPPRFYDGCGCTIEKPVGGQCLFGDCRKVSCVEHFAHCSGTTCGVPLCKEHSYVLDIDGPKILCPRCYEKLRPKLFSALIERLLSR